MLLDNQQIKQMLTRESGIRNQIISKLMNDLPADSIGLVELLKAISPSGDVVLRIPFKQRSFKRNHSQDEVALRIEHHLYIRDMEIFSDPGRHNP